MLIKLRQWKRSSANADLVGGRFGVILKKDHGKANGSKASNYSDDMKSLREGRGRRVGTGAESPSGKEKSQPHYDSDL
ncbi:hypothetical protein Nepgr_006213 [Nepenthes gracilis]|uniref:Uncharacterized protein n=1 Tax=Nepenthes gracilis TaxID=150966 RepID=A0AAD3S500_NEPGR|nr:hypothetical protein Nepgr_006213 [Nepenthes gracilis]